VHASAGEDRLLAVSCGCIAYFPDEAGMDPAKRFLQRTTQESPAIAGMARCMPIGLPITFPPFGGAHYFLKHRAMVLIAQRPCRCTRQASSLIPQMHRPLACSSHRGHPDSQWRSLVGLIAPFAWRAEGGSVSRREGSKLDTSKNHMFCRNSGVRSAAARVGCVIW